MNLISWFHPNLHEQIIAHKKYEISPFKLGLSQKKIRASLTPENSILPEIIFQNSVSLGAAHN